MPATAAAYLPTRPEARAQRRHRTELPPGISCLSALLPVLKPITKHRSFSCPRHTTARAEAASTKHLDS